MKILLAEDELITRTMLKKFLMVQGFEVIDVDNGDAAWEILQSPDAPRLAVLDWIMPGKQGPELCRLVRDHTDSEDSYTYIILLTAKAEKGDVVEGIEAGADDYMLKPFDREELRVRVRAGERIVRLQAELVETKRALADQASRDELTGILNRRGIMRALEYEVVRAQRNGTPILVSLADVDLFKAINDTHGHQVGDTVLTAIVDRICTKLRKYDYIGRYGGEEFLILVTGMADTCDVGPVERLRQCLEDSPIQTQVGPLAVTCSFGASYLSPDDTLDSLLKSVDEALYEAKRRGRNCVVRGDKLEIQQ